MALSLYNETLLSFRIEDLSIARTEGKMTESHSGDSCGGSSSIGVAGIDDNTTESHSGDSCGRSSSSGVTGIDDNTTESHSGDSCGRSSSSGVAGIDDNTTESHSGDSCGRSSSSDLKSQEQDYSHELFLEVEPYEKHPNFKKLTDVSLLKIEDLPPVYRDTEMFELIKALSVNVIKINYIDNRGRLVIGSGIVDDVMISTDDDCMTPCMCDRCSSNSAKEWGSFSVVTATKLACGSPENVSKFVCTLFYNNEDQNNVQQLYGHRLVTYNELKDFLIFSCVTSDVSLLRKLKEGRDTFSKCWKKTFLKYYQTVKWEQEKIVFSVFHPYGLQKHLSIGHQLSRRDDEVEGHTTGYDLPMCPGCIGAYVMVPDFDVVEEDLFDC